MPTMNEMLRQHLCGLHVVRSQGIGFVQITGARGKHQRDAFFGGALAQVITHPRRAGDDHPVDALRKEHIQTGKELIGLATAVKQKDHPSLRFKRFGQARGQFGIKGRGQVTHNQTDHTALAAAQR